MKTYTRKEINQNAAVHDRNFVISEHVEDAISKVLSELVEIAIECGADEKLLLGRMKE